MPCSSRQGACNIVLRFSRFVRVRSRRPREVGSWHLRPPWSPRGLIGRRWTPAGAPQPRGRVAPSPCRAAGSSAGTVPLLLVHRDGSFDSSVHSAPHRGDLDVEVCREQVAAALHGRNCSLSVLQSRQLSCLSPYSPYYSTVSTHSDREGARACAGQKEYRSTPVWYTKGVPP